MDPVDSAPVNSLASQSSERGIEERELKQVSMEKDKQVIVNNYYINDRTWRDVLNVLDALKAGNENGICSFQTKMEIYIPLKLLGMAGLWLLKLAKQ